MPYDPNRHHRRSIRLQGYDYSRAGAYFVTILVKDRACVLGEVVEGEMRLSEVGEVVQEVWDSLPARYPGVETDAFVVMPNHVHGIIVITDEGEATARESSAHRVDVRADHVRADHDLPQPQPRRQMLLPKIIGYFKMNAAKRANLILGAAGQPFWQRNYYEHIIRDADALNRIRTYIANNPAKWYEDQLQPDYPSKW
ncbi:MAG: transposase [Caldilineales bacterium]|nr:transposase [Caldilineales bacterium]